jgi:uncharacterized membrane protein YvbJ
MAKKGKNRDCPACGESYSRQRLRCPSCGEPNDLLKEDTAPRGLVDLIPGLQGMSDTTRILIGAFGTLIAIIVGVLIYFSLRFR